MNGEERVSEKEKEKQKNILKRKNSPRMVNFSTAWEKKDERNLWSLLALQLSA